MAITNAGGANTGQQSVICMSEIIIAVSVVAVAIVTIYTVFRYDTQTPEPTDKFQSDETDTAEYNGPRLGEPVKFAMLVGPEDGANIMPMENGGVYITPQTAYQRRNGEWVDLEVETEPLFRAVATYVDPQAIRQQQQHNQWNG